MSNSVHVYEEGYGVREATDWPRLVAFALIAALAVLVAATFRDYGISWDEMLQNTYGQKLLDYYTTGFHDRSAFTYANLYLYGGLFDIVAAVINLVSPFGEYETRHLLGGIVFIAGIIGAWKLVDLLAGSRAALIAVIFLATTPLLYGHAFINPKDSPFAWLLVWVIYYGCRILERPERPTFGALVGFAVTLGLALGTRVLGLAFLAYMAAVLSLYIWVNQIERMRWVEPIAFLRQAWGLAVPLAAVLPVTVLVMAVFWPWSVQSPTNIYDALRTFSHFTWHPLVLWGGDQVPSTNLPRVYLTRLLFLQLPEYVLIGVALSAAFGLLAVLRGGMTLLLQARPRQYLYLALCAVMPIVAFMIMRPVVYNGMRHFLFVVPPLVILAALAADRALSLAVMRGRTAAIALVAVLAVALAAQTVRLVRLHPYEYISYNSIVGGIAGAEKRYELDYWGTSLGEAAHGLGTFVAKNRLGDASNRRTVFVCGDRMSVAYFLPHSLQITERLSEADFYIGINDPPCRDHFDNPLNPIYSVQREGVTLSYVLDLRKPPGR